MKKVLILIIVISTMLISSCGTSDNKIVLNEGDYFLKTTDYETIFLPTINLDNDKFTFSYDTLSSYLPVGSFEISENKLILKTDDNKYKYVFRIEDKSLFFIKSESLDVMLTDSSFGTQIENDSEFVFSD